MIPIFQNVEFRDNPECLFDNAILFPPVLILNFITYSYSHIIPKELFPFSPFPKNAIPDDLSLPRYQLEDKLVGLVPDLDSTEPVSQFSDAFEAKRSRKRSDSSYTCCYLHKKTFKRTFRLKREPL